MDKMTYSPSLQADFTESIPEELNMFLRKLFDAGLFGDGKTKFEEFSMLPFESREGWWKSYFREKGYTNYFEGLIGEEDVFEGVDTYHSFTMNPPNQKDFQDKIRGDGATPEQAFEALLQAFDKQTFNEETQG